MENRLRSLALSDGDRTWLGALGFVYGVPALALPFVGMRWAQGPRWLLDGTWIGAALFAALLVLFAAALLVGPFVHLVRPHLERLPTPLRTATGVVFFALPWSAVVYWLVPKNSAAGNPLEWLLVIGTPALLASVLVERYRSVLAASLTFALVAVVPLFFASDVRTPFVTLWTYGGALSESFLSVRVAGAAAAAAFALTWGEPEESENDPTLWATALGASAVLGAVTAPLFGARPAFDGAALAMPFVVLLARRSSRLALWAPKIAWAQVVASAAVAVLSLATTHGAATAPALAHGAFAVIVGSQLARLLEDRRPRVRVPVPVRR